jgi:hypothetical protein
MKSGEEVSHYNCAQRLDTATKPKKHALDESKQRDRSYQERFSCGGRMRIVSTEANRDVLRLQLSHLLPHKPYCDISPSEAIKERVKELCEAELTPNQVSP